MEDLGTILRAIQHQDLTIDGANLQKRRTCHITSMEMGGLEPQVARARKLHALRRTLKVQAVRGHQESTTPTISVMYPCYA